MQWKPISEFNLENSKMGDVFIFNFKNKQPLIGVSTLIRDLNDNIGWVKGLVNRERVDIEIDLSHATHFCKINYPLFIVKN